MRLSYGLTVALLLTSHQADSQEMKILSKGSYVRKDVGCTGVGGAASMYFDGENLSGHYQICKTKKQEHKHMFSSTCIEAQGPEQPTIADIDKDPDKRTVFQRIVVKSKTELSVDNIPYEYCGP